MAAPPKSSLPPRLTAARGVAAVLVLCALATPGGALGLHGDHHPDQKRAIEGLEVEWRNAQLAGDVRTMDRMLADDFVGINMAGEVNTKTQLLNRARNRVLVLSRFDLREIKVKVLDHVAVVTVRAAVQGTNDGRPVDGIFRYTRIYHRLPTGAWVITNFEATRMSSPGPHRREVAERRTEG